MFDFNEHTVVGGIRGTVAKLDQLSVDLARLQATFTEQVRDMMGCVMFYP